MYTHITQTHTNTQTHFVNLSTKDVQNKKLTQQMCQTYTFQSYYKLTVKICTLSLYIISAEVNISFSYVYICLYNNRINKQQLNSCGFAIIKVC